ncbi:MAG TPA: nucleoside 2-deoxyribosyltransferase domain-containing protein [Kofleriaceae bacterium]|nr:nucleoside 2-deoxyribosyltransferase domain-containing protein [Kofleriaceae bacterium]
MFLAGSTELNAGTNWQTELVAILRSRNVMILNLHQREWEIDSLERADLIAMWFAAETVAPITLLELGLAARSDKLVVGCPDGYWRKSNIEVVCSRFGIPLTTDWAAFVAIVCAKLELVAA